MSPRDNGRLCTECNKLIKEYTQELAPHGATLSCSRFQVDQVSFYQTKYEIRNFKPLTLSLLALLAGGISAQNDSAMAQEPDSTMHPQFNFNFDNLYFPLNLKGTISSIENGEVIPNAFVRFIQNDTVIYTTRTDNSGNFRLYLERKRVSNAIFQLRVSHTDMMGVTREDSVQIIELVPDSAHVESVFIIDLSVEPALQVPVCIKPNVSSTIIAQQWFQGASLITAGVMTIMPKITNFPEIVMVVDTNNEKVNPHEVKFEPASSLQHNWEKKTEIKNYRFSNKIWLVLASSLLFSLLLFLKLRG